MQMPKTKSYIIFFLSLYFWLATASVEQGKPILLRQIAALKQLCALVSDFYWIGLTR